MYFCVRNERFPVHSQYYMGIVNYRFPSFLEDFSNKTIADAVNTLHTHIQDGADIIDCGVQSTHPQSPPIDPKEEQSHLLFLLQHIQHILSHATPINKKRILLSVDTYKASVAKAVLDYGCDIINDISSCAIDPALAEIVAEYKPAYVLTHNSRGRQEGQTINSICDDFEKKLKILIGYGLPEDNIMLDIGVGFGKTYQEHCDILKNINALRVFNRPLVLGISHKAWYTPNKNISMEERSVSTFAATAVLATQGIFIHRVHNVRTAKLAVEIANLIGQPVHGINISTSTNDMERPA